MIKATEIRLGNYYQDENGNVKTVTPNTIEEVWNAQRSWCKPIPLTTEWLERFGFVKDAKWKDLYKLGDFGLWHYPERNSFMLHQCKPDKVNYIYVHQLMNLYFAITGQELTTNN